MVGFWREEGFRHREVCCHHTYPIIQTGIAKHGEAKHKGEWQNWEESPNVNVSQACANPKNSYSLSALVSQEKGIVNIMCAEVFSCHPCI